MGNLRTITHSPLNSTYQYGLFNVVASKALGRKEYSVVVIEPSQNSRNSLNIDK